MRKTVLITGASSGIGKATAILFQQHGWNVSATMRTPTKAAELASLENVFVTRLDVLDQSTIANAISETLLRFEKIDVVVNNAGYGMVGVFESASMESIQQIFRVNVFGLFDVTRSTLPHFRENKKGLFINISSNAGKITYPLSTLYHSTKFAVEGFSESLHYELESIGIGVKIIEPGAIYTDFGTRSLVTHSDESLKEYQPFTKVLMDRYAKMVSKEKMSSPDLVAAAIFKAATDETDQLRYEVGPDAEHLLGLRRNMSDKDFFKFLKNSLGLNENYSSDTP